MSRETGISVKEEHIGRAIEKCCHFARKHKRFTKSAEFNAEFRTVYNYFYPRIYSRVRDRVHPHGQHEDIEEIANDILEYVCKNFHKFQ